MVDWEGGMREEGLGCGGRDKGREPFISEVPMCLLWSFNAYLVLSNHQQF